MKDMDIAIRAYEAADLEKLSAIWFEASLVAHAFIGETSLREQRVLIETVYLPGAETWVAMRGGEPAGFISLVDDFIGGLFVSPRHQGGGIGRLLIQHAAQLKDQLRLEVYTANAQAFAFYRALGFAEVSRRPSDDQGAAVRERADAPDALILSTICRYGPAGLSCGRFLLGWGMRITIKRVYEPAAETDGRRILVDRLWPRGLSKEKARVDLWLKEIAPTTELRKWFGHDPEKWSEFQRRYRAELGSNEEAVAALKQAIGKGPATLLFGARDQQHNEAVVLRDLLLQHGPSSG